MLFCVLIVFSIWKTCIRTLMTIRMVSVTPISICPFFLFVSLRGDASMYNFHRIYMSYIWRTNRFSFFLPLRLCRYGSLCHWFGLHPSQDSANYYSARRGSTSEHYRSRLHSPNKCEGIPLWLFFGGALGKQDREGTTIIPIFLLCAARLYVAVMWVFMIALFDKVPVHSISYLFCMRCIGAPTRIHVVQVLLFLS